MSQEIPVKKGRSKHVLYYSLVKSDLSGENSIVCRVDSLNFLSLRGRPAWIRANKELSKLRRKYDKIEEFRDPSDKGEKWAIREDSLQMVVPKK